VANGAPGSGRTNPGGLTEREIDVLRHVAAGLSRREISKRLVISESTARTHLEHIYRKIGVSTRVGAALYAVENNLVG
jgi:DNA-binding CsgD family transcriptional regulator